ncbi:DUF3630 family protein [Thalassomonas sp. M1454]|uniref:DUF3630 family protein n=1 Tax=Thalassomonas sp. M1454 TaxID=2594477 RepID=UPI001180824D|nr:DUF3630 family protein [Thalassomonas sp. M1454]TRX55074.1 DUF3630 family protein [Thalassomonas sp. M1454]
MHLIDKARLDNEDLILISFKKAWDQDDIKELADLVFSKIKSHRIIEHVTGADREYIRFNYHDDYLILHFESYSNACWIEAEDQLPSKHLKQLSTVLQA